MKTCDWCQAAEARKTLTGRDLGRRKLDYSSGRPVEDYNLCDPCYIRAANMLRAEKERRDKLREVKRYQKGLS